MAKRSVKRTDFPHLQTGASMFPEKPPGARKCAFCGRKRSNGMHVGQFTLCSYHDDPMWIRQASKIYVSEPDVPRGKRRKRVTTKSA